MPEARHIVKAAKRGKAVRLFVLMSQRVYRAPLTLSPATVANQ